MLGAVLPDLERSLFFEAEADEADEERQTPPASVNF